MLFLQILNVKVLPTDLDTGEGAEWAGYRRKTDGWVNTATQVLYPLNPLILIGDW